MTKDGDQLWMAPVIDQWRVALRRAGQQPSGEPQGERAGAEGIVQESGWRLGDFNNYVNKHAKSAPVYLASTAKA